MTQYQDIMDTNKIKFKPFDRVLVRDSDDELWSAAFYDKYIPSNESYPYRMIGYTFFAQCIPYEGNEHLVGTTDSPKLKACKLWKPKLDETFFSIVYSYGESFYVDEFGWGGSSLDEEMYRIGNCFQTREEAQETTDVINKIIKYRLLHKPLE